jgi:PAS domain S-box-containing protein
MATPMHPGAAQAAITLVVAGALATFVATRRERSPQQWLLFGLLTAVALWSAGEVQSLLRIGTDSELVGTAIGFLGVVIVPPLWLLLAAQQARAPIVVRRLRASTAILLLPSLVAYVAVVTNASHHLFFNVDVAFDTPPVDSVQAGGPIFWAFALWSQLCGLGGTLLLLSSTRHVRSHPRRRPAILLAAAALLPLLVNALVLVNVSPLAPDPTPLALTISLALVTTAIFRFRILDGTLPLARRDVLEHLSDGLLIADVDGVVLDLNLAATQLLGRRDLRGRTLLEALRSVDWDIDRARLEAGLAFLEEGTPPVATVLRSRDDRWVEMSGAVVLGRHGVPAGQYVVLHDRTEQRRYERLVHQSQKLETVGGMVAGIAHEVNNPLSYVRSNLGTLLHLSGAVERRIDAFPEEEREGLAEMRQITEETLDGVERIGRIVDGLRRFSRPHSDEALPVDLNAVARQAVRLAELHANRDVIVTARLAQALPRVKGSADRLGQVALNLLMNAKHALSGRPFGRIAVETLARRGGVELHVSDNGPGIPEEIQDRIFDPFFTTKGPDEGTGLGLSIAFDIVREHGGSLEIVSRPGEGARFIVRLPSG